MGPAVAVLVPVLGRPHRVAPFLEGLWDSVGGAPVVTPVFIPDPDDWDTLEALEAVGARWVASDDARTYATKINLGYWSTADPLLFMAADDVKFHPGWLSNATALLSAEIQVVGTNDLGNPRVLEGNHSTHTLFTRDYVRRESGVIDRRNTVLHPGYPHEYCDDEFIQTAQMRKRFAMASDSIVEHLHPLWGKSKDDDTYRLGRLRSLEGRRIYRRRRIMWQRPGR